MKPLRPITTITLGPLILGLIFTLIAQFGIGPLDVHSLLDEFAAGALFGVLILAPIAGAEAFRKQLARLIGPHAFRVNWHASILGAMALGYLFAMMRHHTADGIAIAALITVFFVAMLKLMLLIVFPNARISRIAERITDH